MSMTPRTSANAVTADGSRRDLLVGIARGLGIEVHDHIIVGRDGHASLRGLKLM